MPGSSPSWLHELGQVSELPQASSFFTCNPTMVDVCHSCGRDQMQLEHAEQCPLEPACGTRWVPVTVIIVMTTMVTTVAQPACWRTERKKKQTLCKLCADRLPHSQALFPPVSFPTLSKLAPGTGTEKAWVAAEGTGALTQTPSPPLVCVQNHLKSCCFHGFGSFRWLSPICGGPGRGNPHSACQAAPTAAAQDLLLPSTCHGGPGDS